MVPQADLAAAVNANFPGDADFHSARAAVAALGTPCLSWSLAARTPLPQHTSAGTVGAPSPARLTPAQPIAVRTPLPRMPAAPVSIACRVAMCLLAGIRLDYQAAIGAEVAGSRRAG